MAEVYSVTTGATAIGAAATKTVIELATASTASGRIVGLTASFDLASGTPPAVEIGKYTATGTGTTYTPLKYNGEAQNRAAVWTAKINHSVEPSTFTLIDGLYVYGNQAQWPLGRELYVPPSAFYGVRLITPSGVSGNYRVTVIFEE